MMGYYIIAGLIFLVSMFVSNKLKSKFKKYSKVHLQNGLSGREIAEKMLRDNGINDVKVISTPGMLSDHYNPSKKPLTLVKAYTLKGMQRRRLWQPMSADMPYSMRRHIAGFK